MLPFRYLYKHIHMKKISLLSPIGYLALSVSSILVSTPYAEAVDRSG